MSDADLIQEGDDHIRRVKDTLTASFPNISGAINPAHADGTRAATLDDVLAELKAIHALLERWSRYGVPSTRHVL